MALDRLRIAVPNWRPAQAGFGALCVVCEAALLAFDRQSAYIAIGAAGYGLFLWVVTSAFIPVDRRSEETTLKTAASGWRLGLRVAVVAATVGLAVFGRQWWWNGQLNGLIQQVSVKVGLGDGDTALPNFLFYVVVPGVLLFLLGTKPRELGLTSWRKGAWYALLGALVLPAILGVVWLGKGHGTTGLLMLFLAHNFLSNGFSEEFLMRGMVFSHLRAFVSKEWAIVTQAVLFGLFHLNPFQKPDNWALECARDVAMNAPIGYFLALTR